MALVENSLFHKNYWIYWGFFQCNMQSSDKLEKERMDAKNNVEEYIYDIRDKLGSKLKDFVLEADSEKFSSLLYSTEDWLYDEGEDQLKQVYVDKLAELKVRLSELH